MYYFEVDNKMYEFGSEMFPIAKLDKIKVFTNENTSPITDATLALNLDKMQFIVPGRCYSNTYFVEKYGKLLRRKIEFYSGWMFIHDGGFPMHHAWAVYDGNIIDVSVDIIMRQMFLGTDYSNPNWREDSVEKTIEYLKKKVPTTKSKVFGQVPPWATYVGSPDNCENARRIARYLMDKFPDHPSYCPMNSENETKMQELLNKRLAVSGF